MRRREFLVTFDSAVASPVVLAVRQLELGYMARADEVIE